MFLFILFLILLAPLTLFPGLIHEIFSPDELYAMGIRLENSRS